MMAVIPKVSEDLRIAVPTVPVFPSDYKIVTGTAAVVTSTVKSSLAEGWIPQGAVSGVSSTLYAQAMVKYPGGG